MTVGDTDSSPTALRRYMARDRLLDGRALLVRAIRPDDKQLLQSGVHRMSPQSAYLRFLSPKHELSEHELIYLTEVDFADHVAQIAVVQDEGDIIEIRFGLSERETA